MPKIFYIKPMVKSGVELVVCTQDYDSEYKECLPSVRQGSFVVGFVDTQSSIEYVYSYFERKQKKKIVA